MHKLNLYLLVGLIALGTATYGQEKRYPIGSSNNVLNSFRNQITATQRPNGLSRLQLQLSPSLSLPAAINFRRSVGTGSEQLAGSIENVPNSSFYLMIEGKSVYGHILLHNTRKAYKYYSDDNGAVFVEETDINKVVCIDYQKANNEVTDASTEAPANAAAAVADLQSYPGGNGCVLLDFDGQLVSGTGWNNGNPINAAPANLSDADKEKVWQLISEDYRPFHINITTSEAVFNTYPKTRRMRCIFTPTNTAAPGAGGVAYVGSFKSNDDTPCWVFNSGARAAGEAGSHEVGHTLGLSHDGRTSPAEEYYQGQGNWAPIMGVGYYVSLVQWSKGEYTNASQKQDDLSIITSTAYGLGYRADDYGNTTTAAAPLTINTAGSVSNAGIIERTGDVDMFAFSTSGGNLNLTFTSNATYPDLDILATLYNSNGTAITTSNPTGLHASISSTLAAGNYYVSVTGTGSGDPAVTGYSNYGSLGTYTLTGTITGGGTPPAGNKLPTVSITSPANGNTFTAPANIPINASATDSDGVIAKVEFFNGATKLGESGTAPYSYAWSNVAAGTYTIKAIATDNRGGQATAQITVSVGNTPGVTVYKDCNYGGYAITLPIGTYTLTQLMAKGAVNDDISSLKVNSGYEAILYRDNNFAGPAYLFRGNASCLVSVGLSGGSTVNLNDWTSSVVIRQTAARAAMEGMAKEEASSVVPFTEYTPSLQILPNPVNNEVVVRYGNMGDHFDVTIVNLNGGVVYSAPRILSGQHINIVTLRPGVYFIKINTGKETITRKLIKR